MARDHLDSCPSLISGHPEDCSCKIEEGHYITLAKWSFGLFLFEVVGGFLSGSMALISDGVHVLADGTENIINIVVSRLSRKSENEHDIREVGGMMSGSLLFGLGVWIIFEGWGRLIAPEKVEPFMVFFAFTGLLVNLRQQWIHSKALPEHRNKQHFWQSRHLWSDIGASIAVIIGGLLMLISNEFYWIDGMLSIGIGILIVVLTGAKLLGVELHHHDHAHCNENEHTHKH